MRDLWVRLVSVYNARGPKAFALFVLTRFVRRHPDLLFEIDPQKHLKSSTDFDDYHLIVINRNNPPETLDDDLIKQLFNDENSQYRSALYDQDSLYFVMNSDRQVLHFSYVQHKTRYKKILDEPLTVPLIGNCFTSSQARGQKLYPKTLVEICRNLAGAGCKRVIITCAPDNIPSIKGIERAGFGLVRRVESILILSRFALQIVITENKKWNFRASYLSLSDD
jgi:RimJ/RimL family protein N-acetyltransferase